VVETPRKSGVRSKFWRRRDGSWRRRWTDARARDRGPTTRSPTRAARPGLRSPLQRTKSPRQELTNSDEKDNDFHHFGLVAQSVELRTFKASSSNIDAHDEAISESSDASARTEDHGGPGDAAGVGQVDLDAEISKLRTALARAGADGRWDVVILVADRLRRAEEEQAGNVVGRLGSSSPRGVGRLDRAKDGTKR
jgi:hypothetical protein